MYLGLLNVMLLTIFFTLKIYTYDTVLFLMGYPEKVEQEYG